ncbi:hypothetical protein [Streptomyces sp. AD55]|uniref:hypothetical protein n=1 Tax=Streptomyces sp. AD55 TaxID=3242895 RepID=UPI003527610C
MAEAIDTVIVLGWALLAWIAIAALAVTVTVLAVAGVAWWAWDTARNVLHTRHTTRQGADIGFLDPGPAGPSMGHTEPHTYHEAA